VSAETAGTTASSIVFNHLLTIFFVSQWHHAIRAARARVLFALRA
jgi:hypothetical protein